MHIAAINQFYSVSMHNAVQQVQFSMDYILITISISLYRICCAPICHANEMETVLFARIVGAKRRAQQTANKNLTLKMGLYRFEGFHTI